MREGPEVPTPHYRNPAEAGQGATGPRARRKSLQCRHLVCYDPSMRIPRFLAGRRPCGPHCRARRRVLRQRCAGAPGRSDAAISRVHGGARRCRSRVRRRRAVGPAGLRRDRRHAAHARSAFELLRSRSRTRRCASGRKAITTAWGSRFRSVDGDITVHVDLRGLARIQEGSPPERHHRARSRGSGHEGLDERSGGQEAQGAERHERQHLDQARRATTG